ncbi:MAG: hypothetical protein K2J73_06805 [Oscillospiraceae bacterium]|nr:hypothetical protein [Oscillospiraceae bacterium]
MTISGVNSAAELYKYVSQGGNAGGATFADALSAAAEADEAMSVSGNSVMKSDEEIIGETLMDIYRKKQQKDNEEKEPEKDFWELRTERQKLLDEYFEKKELQRKAFEKLALKRQQERECLFNGEGVLFLHSAAADIFAHMGML